LPDFWDDNLESMLAYLERVHEGLRGIVIAADSGEPLVAEIRLDADPFPVYSSPQVGDYHRIVLPGTYDVHVSAPGYQTRTFDQVVVSSGAATRLDVSLEPLPGELQPARSRVEDGGDGVLEPGETGNLAVSLHNSGRGSTGVTAELRPISWLVEVTRPLAAYPDIPMNGEEESIAPHHEVSVSASAPAGHQAGFYLEWNSAEGHGITDAFYVDVGQADCETVAATDLPQTISKILSAHSEVTAAHRQIHTVRVTLDLQHTYIGDLNVLLTAPTGTTVLLHDRSGGATDDIVGTYPDTLTPAESLDALLGQSSLGTWSLDVTDAELSNNGSLQGWSLEVCGYPAEPTPELRFRDLKAEGGAVELRWWAYPGLWSYKVYRSTDASSAGSFVDVTSEDPVDTDTRFVDTSADPLVYYLVTGVGPQGEGP
jgi:subtilisin-like proprotein convertase family protein